MIRILHVLGTLNTGGAESRIMDLYRHIDRSKVQFDFLVHYNAEKGQRDVSSDAMLRIRPTGDFDDEVKSLGGRIYVLPRFNGKNLLQYKNAAKNFFDEHHEFAAVQGHMTSMAGIYLPIAKKAGVPVTIAHARSAGVDAGLRGFMTRVFRMGLANKCDYCFSCSGEASVSVFGQKAVKEGRVELIPNALAIEAFRFDPQRRRAIREEYGIGPDDFVIGHVGRFDAMKNQRFLVPIVKELSGKLAGEDTGRKVFCLFAGKGADLEAVQAEFVREGLEKQAIFAGQCDREKTIGLYQAFDCFAFPSLYEGLPGTVIEAQASGIPCYISDAITAEVCVSPLVNRLPLRDPGVWIEKIQNGMRSGSVMLSTETEERDRAKKSEEAREVLSDAGFDVVTCAVRMQKWYEKVAADPTRRVKVMS